MVWMICHLIQCLSPSPPGHWFTCGSSEFQLNIIVTGESLGDPHPEWMLGSCPWPWSYSIVPAHSTPRLQELCHVATWAAEKLGKSFTRNNRAVIELRPTLRRGRKFLWKHQHGTWEVLIQLCLPRISGNQANPGHRHHRQVICTSEVAREEQKEAARSLLLLIGITHISVWRTSHSFCQPPHR